MQFASNAKDQARSRRARRLYRDAATGGAGPPLYLREHLDVLPTEEKLLADYPHPLQLYRLPPNGYVSLHDVEEVAADRIKVLRVIERANLSGKRKMSEEWSKMITDDLRKQKLKLYYQCKSEDDLVQRHRDHIGHFALRLAYCRTEDLRRWFLTHELDLFRLRFALQKPQEIRDFLALNKLHYAVSMPSDRSSELQSLLQDATPNGASLDFYLVPFTSAVDLVRARKVLVRKGLAYVPSTDLASLVSADFRLVVSEGLARTGRALGELVDPRLKFLQNFHQAYIGNDYAQGKSDGMLTVRDIDAAATSFPPCMRFLHLNLRTNHHLKHGSRLQYGLFLKGAGLTIQDALMFWREEFTKLMDADKFERSYAYNIRHSYGKEGKRTDYTPYSCMRIIGQSVGAGDAHGCPFKHWDQTTLRSRLTAPGQPKIGSAALQATVDMAVKGHYQIACQRYFEGSNNCELASGINHPNQYFEESRNVLQGNMPQAPKSMPTTRAVMYTQDPVKEEPATMWGDDDDETFLEAAMMDTT